MSRVTYHLVDLRGDGYRGGYLDTDARILIACFKLFEEFYDKEYPGPVKWDRKVAREIEALHALLALIENRGNLDLPATTEP